VFGRWLDEWLAERELRFDEDVILLPPEKCARLFAFLIILICFNSKFAAIGGIANVAQGCPATRYIEFGYIGGYFY
jgi:hypothetical protein